MKRIKCILAVALGTFLAVFSSCKPEPARQKEPGPSEKEQVQEQTEEKGQDQAPEKEEDLPLRGPMME